MSDLFTPAVVKLAEISQCGRYRYTLTRRWRDGEPALPFIMLNPSTADHETDDPTIRRCMGFARREGFGGIVVVNLFAYRATDPDALRTVVDPIGPENDEAIAGIVRCCAWPIVAAWGMLGGERASSVGRMVREMGGDLRCLGMTKQGHPRHPLYVRGDQPLLPFATPSPTPPQGLRKARG